MDDMILGSPLSGRVDTTLLYKSMKQNTLSTPELSRNKIEFFHRTGSTPERMFFNTMAQRHEEVLVHFPLRAFAPSCLCV